MKISDICKHIQCSILFSGFLGKIVKLKSVCTFLNQILSLKMITLSLVHNMLSFENLVEIQSVYNLNVFMNINVNFL